MLSHQQMYKCANTFSLTHAALERRERERRGMSLSNGPHDCVRVWKKEEEGGKGFLPSRRSSSFAGNFFHLFRTSTSEEEKDEKNRKLVSSLTFLSPRSPTACFAVSRTHTHAYTYSFLVRFSLL